MKDTAESLLDKLRSLSDQKCMNLIREMQANYRLPEKARTIGEMLSEARHQSGAQKLSGHDIMAYADDPASERKRTVGAKCRKAYDLDENGQRIPDRKGAGRTTRRIPPTGTIKGMWRFGGQHGRPIPIGRRNPPVDRSVSTTAATSGRALIKFPLSIWGRLPVKWKSAASAPTREK